MGQVTGTLYVNVLGNALPEALESWQITGYRLNLVVLCNVLQQALSVAKLQVENGARYLVFNCLLYFITGSPECGQVTGREWSPSTLYLIIFCTLLQEALSVAKLQVENGAQVPCI